MQSNPQSSALTAPVIIAVVLLVTAAVAFFVALLIFSPSTDSQASDATPEDYSAIAERLVTIGDATRAQPLLEKYACIACHVLGGENVAPPWETISEVAAQRVPPMTTAEYVYESIVHPGAYLVEGYPASMPQDYGSRMSEQEIADVLVYLLNIEG
ncbi:MAG: c-type cytochrome [Chloroflexi bacterium]|nr:c-type cytochrome [Chloroflexota bacterium]